MAHIYQTLEFDRILNKVAQFAQSELAKDMCLNLKPIEQKTKAIFELKLLQQYIDYLNAFENIDVKGLYDQKQMLEKAKKGVYLSEFEIARIIENLKISFDTVSKMNYSFKQARFDHDLLVELTGKIIVFKDLRVELDSYFNDYEVIKDDATPQLFLHTSNIKAIQNKIKDSLNDIIVNHSDKLSQNTIVLRNDRYVLAVKNNFKSSIKGIIHDQSMSGQTVFIEPRVVVQLHLQLQNELFLKQEEVIKILKMLTHKISEYSKDLLQNQYVLSKLDFGFSKARFAKMINGTIVNFSNNYNFNLHDVWHPLLDEKIAIKNSFSLTDNKKTLLVSGSNTGGKTVMLKTIGIACLMSKCGLPICAKQDAVLPFFEHIFADIGDEQSITNALSTFSSHIKNIKYICENANESTLVILDEIGAGTDPQEGSALAIAIIDYLAQQNSICLASTHFSAVKVFGLEQDFIQNASVLFDQQKMTPTYKWVYDEPGKSHALLIAQKLGLKSEIIANAQAIMHNEDQDLNAKLLMLEQQITETKKVMQDYEMKNHELSTEVLKIAEQKDKLDLKTKKILEKANSQANELVEETKNKLKDLLLQNKEMLKQHEINNALKAVDDLKITANTQEVEPSNLEFSINETVLVKTLNRHATIIQISKNKYVVDIDGKRISLSKDQLAKVEKNHVKPTKKIIRHKVNAEKSNSVYELNLIGLRSEEALARLDQFISQALLNNMSSCRIIHGDGQGILRTAVHQYLKKNKHVKKYELASFYEGGTGATIVTF